MFQEEPHLEEKGGHFLTYLRLPEEHPQPRIRKGNAVPMVMGRLNLEPPQDPVNPHLHLMAQFQGHYPMENLQCLECLDSL